MPNQPTTLYHGSNHLFTTIDVAQGKPYKDFGRGFYTTKNKQHAIALAERNRAIRKRRGVDTPVYLYTYQLDTSRLASYNVKTFDHADIDWIEFIIANRASPMSAHTYDVVIGPTADDDTRTVLNAYFDGLYGDTNSQIAKSFLLQQIEAEKLPFQYFFNNNQATKLLTPVQEVTTIE